MTFIEKFNNNSSKNIVVLIAPLDWGLGHASRCIIIIKYLHSIGCELIIATDGIQEALLRAEFPTFKVVSLPGYGITFSQNRGKTLIKILGQIPKILTSINREKRWLQHFLATNKVDAVISDNRYGLFAEGIMSVFITHQLTIKTPFGFFFEKILRRINYQFIQKFDECWVPDYTDTDNIGGELSHPVALPHIPVKYLGRISRITAQPQLLSVIQLVVIISGPEPQRSIFEHILLKQLTNYNDSAVFIRGLPGNAEPLVNTQKNLTIYNHLPADTLSEYLNKANFIVSRPGYSTVMDLAGLKKKCIFVPTPGQSEQEYLAKYLSSKKFCLSYTQNDFELMKAINEASMYKFEIFDHWKDDQYKKVIDEFVNSLG